MPRPECELRNTLEPKPAGPTQGPPLRNLNHHERQTRNRRRPAQNNGGRDESKCFSFRTRGIRMRALCKRDPMVFQHKNIRLHQVKYIGQHSYFVTLCCDRRRPVFANGPNAVWLIEKLREQSIAYDFAVYAYCVMPDHFHGFFFGLEPTSDLLAFVKNLKQMTANEYREDKDANLVGKMAATNSKATSNRSVLWQKKFYDHILRERDNADAVAAYIWSNPVRKGLCKDPREYPYSGSFVVDWKRTFSTAEAWVPDWKSKPPT